MVEEVKAAEAHGLRSSDYRLSSIQVLLETLQADLTKAESVRKMAELDILLSDAFLLLGNKTAFKTLLLCRLWIYWIQFRLYF